MRRRTTHAERIRSIRKVVAGYPETPADIEEYTWLSVPRYWESVSVPGGGSIEPLREDRHAGFAFKVGWSTSDRVAALWID